MNHTDENEWCGFVSYDGVEDLIHALDSVAYSDSYYRDSCHDIDRFRVFLYHENLNNVITVLSS